MSNAAKKIGKPEAIDLIYDEIMKAYNESPNAKNKKEAIVKEEKEASVEKSKEDSKVIGIKKK